MVVFINWLLFIASSATVDAAPSQIITQKPSPIWEEVLLSLLAIAFVSWAGVVWQASRNLAEKMDSMLRQYHKDRLINEHRLTHVEAMIAHIFNALAGVSEDIHPPIKTESKD